MTLTLKTHSNLLRTGGDCVVVSEHHSTVERYSGDESGKFLDGSTILYERGFRQS
jgi:hypothetical protein